MKTAQMRTIAVFTVLLAFSPGVRAGPAGPVSSAEDIYKGTDYSGFVMGTAGAGEDF